MMEVWYDLYTAMSMNDCTFSSCIPNHPCSKPLTTIADTSAIVVKGLLGDLVRIIVLDYDVAVTVRSWCGQPIKVRDDPWSPVGFWDILIGFTV